MRWSGAVYERLHAACEHRTPQQIYHSALVVHLPESTVVVEQGPAARHGERRGVVVTGPVGLAAMTRWPLPRYEVRCCPDGTIDDIGHLAGDPVRLTTDVTVCRSVVASAADVPALVWGRDESGAGEMWNSNSVIAWILQHGGIQAEGIEPPPGGGAPGWSAGWRGEAVAPDRPDARTTKK